MSLAAASERYDVAARRFSSFFDELNHVFVERGDVLAQIAVALLAREHVLMTGPPGTAKSNLASSVLGRIVDETSGAPSLYARQFTESTVQTDLVGPINFKTLMETGRTEHFTDEGMLGAVHAFLDEVLDGRDMLLRGALNVLQERELKQGGRTTRGRIECAVMTTNRYLAEVLTGSRETLLAFVDRIAFVSFVPKGFGDPANLALVLRRQLGGGARAMLETTLTIQDLDVLQAMADEVVVPEGVCASLVALLESFDAELAGAARADPEFVPTRYLSVRTAVRAGRVLRALCVYEKVFHRPERALVVEHGDLSGLRLQLLLAGPPPDAIDKLLARENDPRERRQLSIVRTERELFARCIARLPAPPPEPEAKPKPEPNLKKLRTMAGAAVLSDDPAQLLVATRALATAAAAPQKHAVETAKLLRETVGALAERALRLGLTATLAEGRAVVDVATELAQTADALEDASPAARPVARWLRGRAWQLIDGAAALAFGSGSAAGALLAPDEATRTRSFATTSAASAGARVDALDLLGALRARLAARGVDAGEVDPEQTAWKRAVARTEDEIALVLDTGFCNEVASTLAQIPSERVGQVLTALGPALDLIDTLGGRLAAHGATAGALKSRVVGPRLWPLVAAVFDRVDARDRAALLTEIDALLGVLSRAGLREVLVPADLVRFAAAALVRGAHGATPAPPDAPHDAAGYAALRAAEQRTPVVYTLVEIALRAAPSIARENPSPADAVRAVTTLLETLPEEQRADVARVDLARITRAVHYLEVWWTHAAGGLASADGLDVDARSARLAAIEQSGFVRAAFDDDALARFALEARVVGDVLPAHAEAAAAVRARIESLDARAGALLTELLRARADGAWTALLRPRAGATRA